MKQLSIIIPHYNTPQLLGRLLETIPDRDDIEVIVVDDSSDRELEIYQECVDKYKDRGIIFLNNSKNLKGAGNARNLGIEHATGKWLVFSDADDCFVEETFKVFEKYYDSNSDVIYFSATSIYLDTQKEADRHKYYAGLIDEYLAQPDQKNELMLRYKWWSPCCKMVRKELIDRYNLKYDGTLYSNDMMFSTKTGYYAKEIGVDGTVVYCITKSSQGLTTKVDDKALSIRKQVAFRQLGFLISHLSFKEMKLLGYGLKDYIYYYTYKRKMLR